MNDKQAAIISLQALLESCEKNGLLTLEEEESDPFLRGFAAAHRKIGSFIPHIIEFLED